MPSSSRSHRMRCDCESYRDVSLEVGTTASLTNAEVMESWRAQFLPLNGGHLEGTERSRLWSDWIDPLKGLRGWCLYPPRYESLPMANMCTSGHLQICDKDSPTPELMRLLVYIPHHRFQ
jgi:hypothetical protein